MKRLLYFLYQPYKWLVFFPLFALFTCIMVLLIDDYAANRTTGVWWARLTSYITPVIVERTGGKHVRERQSYIVVSNHQSMYDILVLYGWIGVDLKWVIKKEVGRIPVIGFAAEKGGNIFIDRSNPGAAYESLQEARRKVVNGTSVIILPEGTRSRTGELGEFKRGAFRLARDLRLPILPVTIKKTRTILPPNTLRLFPWRAVMTIHPPIDTVSYDESSFDALIARVREVIKAGLDGNGNKA